MAAQLSAVIQKPAPTPRSWAIRPTAQGAVIPPQRAMTNIAPKAVPEYCAKMAPASARIVGKMAAKPSPMRITQSEAASGPGTIISPETARHQIGRAHV